MSENLPPKPERAEQPTETLGASVDPTKPSAVKFLHEKTPGYHIMHVDGAWGSINHLGNAQLDLYVETAMTPNEVVQTLKPDGSPAGEPTPFGRVDANTVLLVRNMQCGIVLSPTAAIQIHSVLEGFIKMAKQQFDSTVENIKKAP
jgi:hypothetical protein